MNTYLLLFIISTVSSLALTPVVRRVSERFGWLDVPRDERRVHRRAVPRLGGVAVYSAMVLALGSLYFVDNLVTQALQTSTTQIKAVLIPATLVFLFGVYDDLRGASPRFKFAVQGLAGALLFAMGGRVEALSVPLFGSVELPLWVSFALTVVWTVGVTNAFNLIDGMDGLATGAALFAALVMLAVSLMLGRPLVSVMALALTGALIGFLRYNFNPASIFLGDSGSLLIGFTLAALSVLGAQKASTAVAVAIPLLAFGLPVVDTGFSMFRRFVGGRPLFEADREHIHHMLLARGWSQRRVAVILYAVCAFFGLIALLFVSDTAGRAAGLVLFVVGVIVIVAVGHLRYHEVDELRAGVKRSVVESRLRVANNIRVRRAARALSEANNLGAMFDAVTRMLELSEFVYAVAQIGRAGDEGHNEKVLRRELSDESVRGAQMRRGQIFWSWERGDIDAAEIVGSGHFWTLRLPLATAGGAWGYINFYRAFDSDSLPLDTNYLCNLFQREMARAAERVLAAAAHDRAAEGESPVLIKAASGD